jgi:hypothetical protein
VATVNLTDFFGLVEVPGKTYLQRTTTTPKSMQGIAFTNKSTGYTPVYSVLHKLTSTDVELIAAPNASKHRCFLTGIGGDWSQTSANGAVQTYARVYASGDSLRLQAFSPNTNRPVKADASCIQLN